ncbi:MAG: transposase [Deltaproteobacteria bacterium]|nr:transposase [Deltaproteobacteria bacterium]
MRAVLVALVAAVVSVLRSRLSLHLEVLALRHQLAVLQGGGRRPRLKPADRLLWVWLSQAWSGWQDALVLVKPRTVISWQRKRFRDHWRRLSRRGRPGRPAIAQEVRDLIRKMSRANPSWGSPRIRSELRKLGIDLAKSTVEKYMVRPRKPPSPTWRAFLANHVNELVSLDFFTVSTVRFRVLFVLIILAHDRRKVVHFGITEHPTARWTGQQVVEAFPWDTAPRFLLRDRDGVYGADFRRRVKSTGIEEMVIAARSPWQSPYVERIIGSIRRECLANVVVLSERHLRRILKNYLTHYHSWRCHQSLEMDCPEPRPVQQPEVGEVAEIREAGGLYRHYERVAA